MLPLTAAAPADNANASLATLASIDDGTEADGASLSINDSDSDNNNKEVASAIGPNPVAPRVLKRKEKFSNSLDTAIWCI